MDWKAGIVAILDADETVGTGLSSHRWADCDVPRKWSGLTGYKSAEIPRRIR
jgi:hypothetical protein